MYRTLEQRLNRLRREGRQGLLCGGLIGIEKESLRVNRQGGVAQTPHPPALGSALTHPWITTDYSEALLELITPPRAKADDSLDFLHDIHRFVYQNLADELLWATSMPCVVQGDESIPIARYGSSNVGMMKHVYRRGLGHRYGRPMQAIAGIHFNYSAPLEFWPWLRDAEERFASPRDCTNQTYLAMARNIIRYGWLILYLFGSSPALCKSLVGSEKSGLDEFDRNTWYLPWATSLRMSDIGYQNKNQASLNISYNSMEEYVASLTSAIETVHPAYQAIGLRAPDGEWRQLNTSILQIENEYYSIVRPKQIAKSGEKPTLALRRGGVRYVELRALDVNPFQPAGIDRADYRFIEAFLLFCLLQESPPMDQEERRRCGLNQAQVAGRGRQPGLELHRADGSITLQRWADELCAQIGQLSELLDGNQRSRGYAKALEQQREAVKHAELTPSARVLEEMRRERQGFYHFAMEKSKQHESFYRAQRMEETRLAEFQQEARNSLALQAELEEADELSFEEYLGRYFQQR